MHTRSLAYLSFVLVMLLSSLSVADVMERSFETQLFEPAMGLDTYFVVEGPQVAPHLGFGLGLLLDYQHNPLVLYIDHTKGTGAEAVELDDTTVIPLVEHQLTANVLGAFGLAFRWLHAQVGLDFPVHLVVAGTDVDELGEPAGELSATGIGDLKMQLKVMLLRDLGGLSLALSPVVTFPTGNREGFGGDPNLTVRPRVVAGLRQGRLSVALNLGYLIRENSILFSSEVGDQLLYGAGAGFQAHRRVLVMAELFGRAGLDTESGCFWDSQTRKRVCTGSSASDQDAFPLELAAGARFGLLRGLDLSAGFGVGLTRAIGSPAYRFLAGIRWAPEMKDTDRDGVKDYRDKCPGQPEDADGFQDEDGCPDPDNDGDLIPDVRDRCPNEAEDRDTFQDEDGCPDPDNDGDGIPDIKDACPFKPEVKNGIADEDGCPDMPDKDQDGIEDAKDRCPTEAEDADGFQDEDGCPDPDNDDDGVPDSYDDCPLQPEDMDNFKDGDGCPDPDNDGDGVEDAKDRCPDRPETINGYKDEDGCPDQGRSHVQVTENKIVITKMVYFETGKATIRRRSHGILDEVALTLRANPRIKRVRVEGHTDSQGDDAANKALSQKRAEAVQSYLVGKGIAAVRLLAVGFGEEQPIAPNDTRRGREKNRRVELVILEQAP